MSESTWVPIDLRTWPDADAGTWSKGDAAAKQRHGEKKIEWAQDAEDEVSDAYWNGK